MHLHVVLFVFLFFVITSPLPVLRHRRGAILISAALPIFTRFAPLAKAFGARHNAAIIILVNPSGSPTRPALWVFHAGIVTVWAHLPSIMIY